jgi:hypothetical protein
MNSNNNIKNKNTKEIKKNTNILDTENIEDIEFIKYIQSYEDDEDDDELDKLFDSLDDEKDIKQKKIKSIQDIQEECEKNKQHFHITPEEFDNIYDPKFECYSDDYNKVCDNLQILKRLIKRKMFVDVQHRLLGSSRASYINKFKLENPEIELCDIIKFIYNLKTIRPIYQYSVYIDLCQDSKFYVGIAHSSYLDSSIEANDDNIAKSRLESHRDNGGGTMPTNFTHMYPVISCLCSFFGDKEDEDLITILMSKCVGNNVRGGKWASPFNIPYYPAFTINEIKDKLINKKLK